MTGAASGLGEATARYLAEREERARLVLVDLNEERGKEIAAELGGTFVRTDITSPEEVVRLVDAAAALAPVRGVVNCAGGGKSGRTIGRDGSYVSAHDLDAFVWTVNLNVVGTFNVIRIAATAMSRNEPDGDGARGAIVNTASVAAFEGQIGQAAYAAAKGGIVGMTLPIARDLAAAGIRVNTIAPGTFATPPMLAVPPNVLEGLSASVPFPKRLGDPSEYAYLAHHLLTNSYVNGEVVRLDGAIRMPPK
ncbi:short-chain dehydrogenase/reductas [Dactylosporangium sucinum]|uniref:Short-chain dehydrogenase/reductas n=1 Tax=Dactylosporangium sucinum TaxID=1424081 RepID=A0A917U836_9ACTN|nr:short-chain dehydrogenase/reductas [Dactylosporangium sucinum]